MFSKGTTHSMCFQNILNMFVKLTQTYLHCATGYTEPYSISVTTEKCTSNTTYSIIVLFIIYIAPSYSMTTYFTVPPDVLHAFMSFVNHGQKMHKKVGVATLPIILYS